METMAAVGTERLIHCEDIRAEGALEITSFRDTLIYTDEALEGETPCDLLRVTQRYVVGGVFPASRTSDSCECGRFTAKVAPFCCLSLSLSNQRNAQPSLTKISRSSQPTVDL